MVDTDTNATRGETLADLMYRLRELQTDLRVNRLGDAASVVDIAMGLLIESANVELAPVGEAAPLADAKVHRHPERSPYGAAWGAETAHANGTPDDGSRRAPGAGGT